MKEFEDPTSGFQNNTFKKLFGEIRKRNPAIKAEALAMLKLNNENFTSVYTNPDTEIIGDQEDIDLCHNRATYLKIR